VTTRAAASPRWALARPCLVGAGGSDATVVDGDDAYVLIGTAPLYISVDMYHKQRVQALVLSQRPTLPSAPSRSRFK
jgi:hypothetical protein